MFHALDIIRINAFIAHKNIVPPEHVLDQKDFVMAFVDKLIQRAEAMDIRNTRSTHENTGSPEPLINKRMRYSHTSPSLPEKRLQGRHDEHIQTYSDKRKTCKYCSFLKLKNKVDNPEEEFESIKVALVNRMCSFCDVHICGAHWNHYHELNYEDRLACNSSNITPV